MTAEEFYRTKKSGRRIENEYFIAMDKESLFKMMESYVQYKREEENINNAIKLAAKENVASNN